MSEPTEGNQSKPWLYKPGQSGNPSGRPKGSRNKLGEAFVHALYESFQKDGVDAIERVLKEQPVHYLKVIAQVVPKELIVKDLSLSEMSDDELTEFLAAVRTVAAGMGRTATRGRARKAPAEEDTVSEGRLN